MRAAAWVQTFIYGKQKRYDMSEVRAENTGGCD